jgi:hypothetical protein
VRGERDPIGHHLEQVGILVVEAARRHGADMQRPRQPSAGQQGPPRRDRMPLSRSSGLTTSRRRCSRSPAPAGSRRRARRDPAQGHTHTLDGRRVRRQDLADAIQQLDEELLHGQPGEAGIGQRVDVPHPLGDRPSPTVG